MEIELQNNLFDKYPSLFSNKDKTIMQSCMSWGLECGPGWYSIIESVCGLIQQHEENKKDDSTYFPVKFDQVKEKYGGLRIYFSGGDEYVEGIINMAEAVSYNTCEVCGNSGRPNEAGWISTRCEEHRSS